MQKKIFLSLVLVFVFFINQTKAEQYFTGTPHIIDADTLSIDKKKIRLKGVDAPEKNQECQKPYLEILIFSFYRKYNCGENSTKALKKFLNNQKITCIVEDKLDFFGRYLGTCFKHKQNINAWLVRNGHALAFRKYSNKYVNDELQARKQNLGLWKGKFDKPWNWRKKNK